jgi:hypothetical protein
VLAVSAAQIAGEPLNARVGKGKDVPDNEGGRIAALQAAKEKGYGVGWPEERAIGGAIRAEAEELARNPRARSAVLRATRFCASRFLSFRPGHASAFPRNSPSADLHVRRPAP